MVGAAGAALGSANPASAVAVAEGAEEKTLLGFVDFASVGAVEEGAVAPRPISLLPPWIPWQPRRRSPSLPLDPRRPA